MADLLARPSAATRGGGLGSDSHLPSSPSGRRTKRPRWRDTRLLLGILLILTSVVLGARLISSATGSTQWLSVTRSLPAGHVLVAADLRPVKAHLPASASKQYFSADPARLVGRTLGRPLAAGELLASEALASGSGGASRVIPIVVKAGRSPALSAGDHVDVYVLAKGTGSSAGRELRVLTDVEYVGQDPLSTGEISLQLRVSPADAIRAVAASQSNRVDVVRVDRDAADQPGDAGASSIPAYDGG